MAKKHHEEHEEHPDETWLVPYADVLTLLLALFIVLFAVSQVDVQKMEAMSDAFKAAFSGGQGILTGATQIMPLSPQPPQPKSQSDGTKQGFEAESEQLQNMKAQLDRYISDNSLNAQLEAKMTDDGLVIVLKDTLIFPSGTADILPQSYPVLDKVAVMLSTINQRIIIGGHTDNIPINTAAFPSNWDLSSQRATNFLKYMLEHEPLLRPNRFSVAGYADYQPIASNLTETGRNSNRRVEVNIMRNYPQVVNEEY
jgi:chemotaxis protein MotB